MVSYGKVMYGIVSYVKVSSYAECSGFLRGRGMETQLCLYQVSQAMLDYAMPSYAMARPPGAGPPQQDGFPPARPPRLPEAADAAHGGGDVAPYVPGATKYPTQLVTKINPS